MRTYCTARGTLLSALWGPKWEGNPKMREYCVCVCVCVCVYMCIYIYIYIYLIHFVVQQKLTQQCKETILQ